MESEGNGGLKGEGMEYDRGGDGKSGRVMVEEDWREGVLGVMEVDVKESKWFGVEFSTWLTVYLFSKT